MNPRVFALVVLVCFLAVISSGCSKGPEPKVVAASSPGNDPVVVRAVSYDEPSRVLVVTFESGVVYEYYDVPYAVYIDLIDAPSLSLYFTGHVMGRYRYHPEVVVPWMPFRYPHREYQPFFLSPPYPGHYEERERPDYEPYPVRPQYPEEERGRERGEFEPGPSPRERAPAPPPRFGGDRGRRGR